MSLPRERAPNSGRLEVGVAATAREWLIHWRTASPPRGADRGTPRPHKRLVSSTS